MKNTKTFYTEDEYINRNPELHSEDSEWKISKIIHLIDILMLDFDKSRKTLTILDIGGGKGLILREISKYLQSKYKVKAKKEVMDLSPGMLDEQKKTNPDIVKSLNESVVNTSLNDKSVDLALMIDVLEHIPHPEKALIELKRISKFVIFKVPLEDTFIINTINELFDN
jgi:2-polyprenyl-3-methyl-5-hydroxy-6-metoxy-1,4-benzoquinol methylase